MKQQLLTNWNVIRVFYLFLGVSIIAQAIASSIWLGIIFGGYFTIIGILGLGCARNNCYIKNTKIEK